MRVNSRVSPTRTASCGQACQSFQFNFGWIGERQAAPSPIPRINTADVQYAGRMGSRLASRLLSAIKSRNPAARPARIRSAGRMRKTCVTSSHPPAHQHRQREKISMMSVGLPVLLQYIMCFASKRI